MYIYKKVSITLEKPTHNILIPDNMRRKLLQGGFHDAVGKKCLFATVHDAVLHAAFIHKVGPTVRIMALSLSYVGRRGSRNCCSCMQLLKCFDIRISRIILSK